MSKKNKEYFYADFHFQRKEVISALNSIVSGLKKLQSFEGKRALVVKKAEELFFSELSFYKVRDFSTLEDLMETIKKEIEISSIESFKQDLAHAANL